jgi:hypothetical protein
MGTWPTAEFASPVVVKGVARGWFDQTDMPSWSPTYLGGLADEGAECNGVIFPVTPAEFDSYTQRETGYQPTKLDPSQITMLDGSSALSDGDMMCEGEVDLCSRYSHTHSPLQQKRFAQSWPVSASILASDVVATTIIPHR